MHDAAGGWLEPGIVRSSLLDELRALPRDEHLEALAALDRREVEIVLTDRRSITVIVAERWTFTVPSTREDAEG
jgi:glycine/D-amino acid oxidase-like deaminating enzyme